MPIMHVKTHADGIIDFLQEHMHVEGITSYIFEWFLCGGWE